MRRYSQLTQVERFQIDALLGAQVSQAEIDRAVNRLNNRPRKRLGWKTPHQVLYGIKPLVALGS